MTAAGVTGKPPETGFARQKGLAPMSWTAQEVTFSRAFNSEFDAWRRKRPQWRKLTDAIREQRSADEVLAIAADAGITYAEAIDLQRLAGRARADAAVAATLPDAEKALAAAEKRLAIAEKQMATPGLSPNAIATAEAELDAATASLAQARLAVAAPRQAAQTVAAASREGVL